MLLKKRVLKKNKDKFVKQILTHPYPNIESSVKYNRQHPKMLIKIMNTAAYKTF